MDPYRIVFIGTPEFSVPALQALHDNGYNIAAVVTKPDRPKGRGQHVIASPIKKLATAYGYSFLQPTSAKETWFEENLVALNPDLLVVVAYGQILSRSVLTIPRLGAINIHASLLPKYRGPAPIQWAVINGDKQTGVTTMWMDEGMDTGDILLKAEIQINSDETSASLHDKLAHKGAKLLLDTLKKLKSGHLLATRQDNSKASHAPFLKKKDGRIEWSKTADALGCFIRGMDPWPGAFTSLSGKRLRIFTAEHMRKTTKQQPGVVLEGFPGDLEVATGRGVLSLKEVQLESGKRLAIDDFLRGYPVPPGTVLG
jgi:methionyl-tRNA formyltransferase